MFFGLLFNGIDAALRKSFDVWFTNKEQQQNWSERITRNEKKKNIWKLFWIIECQWQLELNWISNELYHLGITLGGHQPLYNMRFQRSVWELFWFKWPIFSGCERYNSKQIIDFRIKIDDTFSRKKTSKKQMLFQLLSYITRANNSIV